MLSSRRNGSSRSAGQRRLKHSRYNMVQSIPWLCNLRMHLRNHWKVNTHQNFFEDRDTNDPKKDVFWMAFSLIYVSSTARGQRLCKEELTTAKVPAYLPACLPPPPHLYHHHQSTFWCLHAALFPINLWQHVELFLYIVVFCKVLLYVKNTKGGIVLSDRTYGMQFIYLLIS